MSRKKKLNYGHKDLQEYFIKSDSKNKLNNFVIFFKTLSLYEPYSENL